MKHPFISEAMLLCQVVGDLHVACIVFSLEVSWYLGRCPLAPSVSFQVYKSLSECLRTTPSLGFTSQDPVCTGLPHQGAPTSTRDHCKPLTFSPPLDVSPLEERFGFTTMCFPPLCTKMCNNGQWKNGVLAPFSWPASILSHFPGSAY